MLTSTHPNGAARHAVGRIVFANDLWEDGERIPLADVAIEVWTDHLLMSHCLGSGISDSDGRFDIPLSHDGHELKLKVRLFKSDRAYPNGKAVDKTESFWSGSVELPSDGAVADLGILLVDHWPYRADYPVPRVGGSLAHLPEKPVWQVLLLESAQGARMVPYALEQFALGDLGWNRAAMEDVQRHFDGVVRCNVQRSESDAGLGQRVLNGHYPCLLARDARDPRRFRLKFQWGDVPCDGEHDLSDVDAAFALDEGRLRPVEITLRIRRPQEGQRDPHEKPCWAEAAPPQTFTPQSAQWEQAKRVFRSHYMLAGEIDSHMGMAHMRVEQYAVAAHRSLRENPIRHLLFPHLTEVAQTNSLSDFIAWGSESAVCQGTVMKEPAIQERFARVSAASDWKGWQPRQPLFDGHQFARIANLYWDFLEAYVSRFLGDNNVDIARYWHEIRFLSRDLVANSLPFAPPPDDRDLVWEDAGERNYRMVGRERYDGFVRAARPISPRDADPTAEDIRNLTDFCKYVIYHATFYHGWVHDRQWADGGSLFYSPLALRNGSLGADDDVTTGPTRRQAVYYLLTLAVGDQTRRGYVLKDEWNDIPPLFRSMLEERCSEFQALGYNVDTLRSRVNI